MSGKVELKPEEWVNNYADSMYRYAVQRVSDSSVAEDLVQDTFLAAFKSIDSFKSKSSEKTWLFAILKRKIIDFYRKASSKYEKNFSEISPFYSKGEFLSHWKADKSPMEWDKKELINPIEFRKILNKCLELLPDKYAAAFKLKTIQGLETKVICNDLDISTSNLWVILHRSRLQLRECLEENWYKKK